MYRGGPELAGAGLPWPNPAQAALLGAAIGPDARVRESFEAWKAVTNIEAPVDGGTYRLLPLLYSRLVASGVEDPLMGRLKGVYRMSWYKNHELFRRSAPAIAALEAAGIQTMLLKGVPLAMAHYPSHALRPMADLDVVVRSSDAEKARAVLAALEWTSSSKHPQREIPDLHAQDLHHPSGAEIDLHWHCLREASSDAMDDWFWASAKPFVFEQVTTLRPAATQMLLQTILHGVRSNDEPPIRWISDAAAVIGATGEDIDWAELTEVAINYRVAHRLWLGLDYLRTQYDLPVPDGVITRLKAQGISIIERVENIVYLGPSTRLYQPTLYPLVDYWRFKRVQTMLSFIGGFPSYICRRWQLSNPWQIPARAFGALLRRKSAVR
jgi:hypothetical protein